MKWAFNVDVEVERALTKNNATLYSTFISGIIFWANLQGKRAKFFHDLKFKFSNMSHNISYNVAYNK